MEASWMEVQERMRLVRSERDVIIYQMNLFPEGVGVIQELVVFALLISTEPWFVQQMYLLYTENRWNQLV